MASTLDNHQLYFLSIREVMLRVMDTHSIPTIHHETQFHDILLDIIQFSLRLKERVIASMHHMQSHSIG